MKKDITFIYSDSAEKAIFQPLEKEAKNRGYETHLTDNPFAKCEIGIYCQHVNFPQYSKFSVIMLHDIIQQYGNWPDIWFYEPWNKYDIGILPSDQWVQNWQLSSAAFYTRPRKGVYKIGWPKADAISELKDPQYRKDFNNRHGLDSTKKTVLYAPAWENDNKEDDFVQAMLGLDVNIIIKQWDADPVKFPNQVENVKRMKALHENIPGVIILPPETNIFLAIAASDILVSEESSTMCEATMMGIPAVSVSDWLIPDVSPSRLPKCDYDFVYMTVKDELSSFVRNILANYEEYKAKTEEFSRVNFANIGNASKMIMDIIDDCVNEKEIRYPRIEPESLKPVPLDKKAKHKFEQFHRELVYNYAIQNKVIGSTLDSLRKIKNLHNKG